MSTAKNLYFFTEAECEYNSKSVIILAIKQEEVTITNSCFTVEQDVDTTDNCCFYREIGSEHHREFCFTVEQDVDDNCCFYNGTVR